MNIQIQKKYKLIKDPIYKQSILNLLNKLKSEYDIIKDENKKLKEIQKINEINIEKNLKIIKKKKMMLKELIKILLILNHKLI